MSLFAIGDLHLHFQSECPAPMQKTDPVWRNHTQKLAANCARLMSDDDTLILLGDHSWGKNLAQCQRDYQYIMDLPGRKILLRGNHDQFWDVGHTARLNECYAGKLFFLQNNFAVYRDYALVGTKGACFEGPFYLDKKGRIRDWDHASEAKAEALVRREITRLRLSFEAARAAGYNRFLMFLHYPPTNLLERTSAFTALAEEYGAHQVVYAHSHGEAVYHSSIEGNFRSIDYSLVSGDYLRWIPKKLLD